MARTVAEVLASARGTINDRDSTGYRTPEADLEGFVRDGLNWIRQERPDLFLGNWGPIGALTGNAALPLDDQYFRPLVDYVIARAETADDEHVVSARAELMAKLAGGFLS